jgi:HSP20 family protein
MRSLMPWTGTTNLKTEMDRPFDRLFENRWEEIAAPGEWAPSLDLSETKDAFMVRAEVPGMAPIRACTWPGAHSSDLSDLPRT